MKKSLINLEGVIVATLLAVVLIGFAVSPAYATGLNLPYFLEVIQEEAFYGDAALTEIVIPDSVEMIGPRAFMNCGNLAKVTIPDRVTSIGKDAFAGCSADLLIIGGEGSAAETYANANHILFENYSGEIRVGDFTFEDNGDDTYAVKEYTGSALSVTIPDRISNGRPVTKIGIYAFGYRDDLISVAIPDSVITIGDSAFSSCLSLTGITIPDSVITIGDGAFFGCDGMTSVTLGNSVATIGDSAFSSCLSLTGITIPDSVIRIDANAFTGCESLASAVIGGNVSYIGDAAFSGCSNLIRITIPDGVTGIGYHTFDGCSHLTTVNLGNNTVNIQDYAFYGCSALSNITLPDSVMRIGVSAFGNCSSLKSISIPSGVTSLNEWVFNGCSALSSVTIPDSVNRIGEGAFSGCSSLKSIHIPDGVTVINNGVFDGCSALTSVTIPGGVTTIEGFAFRDCSGMRSVTIPEGVTRIGNSAFHNCSGLTSIAIPGSMTTIEEWAFRNCSGLTSLVIPNGVTTINESTFSGCTGLKSVTIPNSVTTICSDAFFSCGMRKIVIPDSVTSIGSWAFGGCENLTSAVIPESVTSIDGSAFEWCHENLTIYGVVGSAAYAYAIENEIRFATVIDDTPVTPSATTWNVEIDGGETELRINTSDNWSILCAPEWVSLSESYGRGQAYVTVTATANPGDARECRLLIEEGAFTNSFFISQDGTTGSLNKPTFVYPQQDNETIDFADLTLEWTAEGATCTTLSLRDLTTNHLIIYNENMHGEHTMTLPASTFIAGHQYRAAIGASELENPFAYEIKMWRELLFSVSADDSHSTTLTGLVISANSNPLEGVLVKVRADGRVIATATTDSNGHWELANLYRGAEYTLAFSKEGYHFLDDKTIVTSAAVTNVDTLASENAYDDEIIVLSANTDMLCFGSELDRSELYITSNADWTISADEEWLSFSQDHGTGNSWIIVTAAANTAAEPGSEDRCAIITIEETPGEARAADLAARGASPKSTMVSAQQNSRVAVPSGSVPFEGNKYTGAEVIGTYNISGNLTIDKYMNLYGKVNVTGNVTLKAEINFGNNAELNVIGKLTVSGNGILNMTKGGIIDVSEDFVFDSKTRHESFLKKGTIKVGGDVTIKRNFIAGTGNTFIVKENGKRHTINMWKKRDDDEKQKFGTFKAEAGIATLNIKESFDATVGIWEYRDFKTYHSGSVFELSRIDGLPISSDIKARIQCGIMRMMDDYGKTNLLGLKVDNTVLYPYIAQDGTKKYYTLELNIQIYNNWGINGTDVSKGHYEDKEGNKFDFAITTSLGEMKTVLKQFRNWESKLIWNAFSDEFRGIAIDALASTILDIVPIGSTTREVTQNIQECKRMKDLYNILY